ncbi:rhomboid family intramembrane serine protease [Halobellus limi]|uniref:Rhomboid family intramembrane serine protease n=1 Tax=Halobellus limi TaxID=699433 RepID=A0A1H6AP75_9EURY|nr:rhomboid family intramembrane serine protease [Halobellus limi]QCC47666.1 rhomboid family intramembrane serine protease [Halobellus limi]SEG49974.1 Rhomboid family protein [Halobellus limi]
MAHQTPPTPDSNPGRVFRSIVTATITGSTPAQRALAFGFIPTILLFVGALPLHQQQQWVLNLNDPTVVQLYLSNFVHGDIPHLANNILSYLLLMLFIFPLAVSAGKQRILRIVSILFLTILPLLVSVYSIATLGDMGAETVVGFSGVIAGYAGALPFFIAYHVNEKVADIGVEIAGTSLMGLELGAVLWLAGLRRWSVVLLAVLSVVGLGFAGYDRQVVAKIGREYEVHLVVYALILFAAVPVTLFVGVDAGTNVYGHLIGLIGGFLLMLGVLLTRRVAIQIIT